MNFTPNTMTEICSTVAASLSLVFPNQNWVVMPNIQVEDNKAGLFVSTIVAGTNRVITAQPFVNIVTPWELGSPDMLNSIMGAFQKEFDTEPEATQAPGIEVEEPEVPTLTPATPRKARKH